jgi:hypothetical protein
MIQPEDIKKEALRWYPEILSSSVQGNSAFPRDMRFGKIKPDETLISHSKISNEISSLRERSKEKTGYGYCIDFTTRKDRKIGEQRFPSRIYFNNLDDYLKFIHKEKEYRYFILTTQKIIAEIPQLRSWIEANPQKLLSNIDKWDDLIKVCKYFIKCPKPNVYIRELPLDISTKFVEENKSLLKNLLDVLIEEHLNKEETDFEKRFNLKYKEPLIRLKILDNGISHTLFYGVSDLSIPQSQFNTLNIPCKKVIILENKTNYSNIFNFLTLPSLKNSISIFGQGFSINLLKNAEWLLDKQIIYWGDIDVHGFQIISQLRRYFPKTQSCMMDFETFTNFKDLAVNGKEISLKTLEHLTPEENRLFEYLMSLKENNRLEQEKIPHTYALKKIHELVNT